MNPHPAQRPSLGRAVLFSQTLSKSYTQDAVPLAGLVDAREYAALIVHVDDEKGLIHLQVLTTDPACPVRVVTAPAVAEVLDTWGCCWRWPPRV